MTFSRLLNLAAAFGEITFSRLFAPKTNAYITPNDAANVRSIVVFCYMGLGDAVMVLPMLRALRAAFPKASLDCICSHRTAAYHVLAMAGIFRTMHVYEFKDASLLTRWQINAFLKKQRYDLAVCSYTAPIEHFTPFLLTVPHRVGHKLTVQNYRKPRPDWLFQYPAYIPPSETIHETERYARIVRALMPNSEVVANEATHNFYNASRFGSDLSQQSSSSEKTFSTTPPVIGVHAAVSPHLAWKNWGQDRFFALCKRLQEEMQPELVLFGDASERELLLTMANTLGGDKVRVVTPLPNQNPHDSSTLEQTCIELLKCDILIGNESGVGHVAMSLGVPTIRIFGMTDYTSFRALDTAKHTDIRKDLPCSPCFVLGKVKNGYNMSNCGHHNCLRTISVDEVFEVAKQTLQRTSSSSTLSPKHQ
jgi:ADP-heptose:LPS heptosyltransferase